MTHNEIEELLGAYALDALDADERQEVEAHLATCPRCRAEIAAHREVTALLGNSVGDGPAVAPDDLWDRISASLQDEPPALSPVVRPSRGRRLAAHLDLRCRGRAALILVVGLLAAKVCNLDNQVTGLNHRPRFRRVILNPAHKTVQLTSTPAGWSVEVVMLAERRGLHHQPVHAARSVARRPSSSGHSPVARSSRSAFSARRPNGAAIRVEPTMTVLMITAEPVGGTPAPTTPVLVRGNLPVRL